MSDPDELPPPRCMNCGYNVQGVRSDNCPECGREYHIAVSSFDDAGRFNAAAASLADEGIEYWKVELRAPRQVMHQLMGLGGTEFFSTFGSAALFVRRSDWPRARDIVDELAATAPRPIVDRSEPNCPKCNALLDVKGPEQCQACGAKFQWVEIHIPDVGLTGVLCPHCQYDLTGNVSENCPECGSSVPPPTLDALVAAAVRDDSASPMKSTDESVVFRLDQRLLKCNLLIVGVFLVVALGVATIWVRRANPSPEAIGGTVGAIFILGILAVGQAVRKSFREEHSDKQLPHQ